MMKLAARCKFTLIGKFSNTMPKVGLIRRSFILQTQLSGGVKIAHFNARYVYIDLDNELDYITVWTKQKMIIKGQLMRIQTWTPTFKPDEETPIVPVWVSLPELPWHCYNKKFVSALLSPIGKVLYLDSASIHKTRGSLAKVSVERPPHVWMGFDKEDITIGRWQPIRYESVPDYCSYYKHQGHMRHVCTVKKWDEDQNKKKEQEVEKKAKNKENEKKEQTDSQVIERQLQAGGSISGTKHQSQQDSQEGHQEEQW